MVMSPLLYYSHREPAALRHDCISSTITVPRESLALRQICLLCYSTTPGSPSTESWLSPFCCTALPRLLGTPPPGAEAGALVLHPVSVPSPMMPLALLEAAGGRALISPRVCLVPHHGSHREKLGPLVHMLYPFLWQCYTCASICVRAQ